MAERTDQWPRVHSCLYNWCPKKSDECQRCDAVATYLANIDKINRSTDREIENSLNIHLPIGGSK